MFENMMQQKFFLGSNIFWGPASTVTSRVFQKPVINDNDFVGNLPDEYISLPRSELLPAYVNCLSPQLPLSLCNSSSTLSELYLNGLQQSSLCKSKSKIRLTSLPLCIWSQTSLSKLYLPANDYTGKVSNISLLEIVERDMF